MRVNSGKYFPFVILILIIVFGAVPYASSMSAGPEPPGSCRGIKLCKSLEGREFDIIKYSSMGSELVILYDKSVSGEIYPTSMASLYEKSRGTVNDAIRYLKHHPDYDRFIIRKARKSTGLFKAEILDRVFLILPKYKMGEVEAPEYGFFEKEGQLRVKIRPVIHTDILNN